MNNTRPLSDRLFTNGVRAYNSYTTPLFEDMLVLIRFQSELTQSFTATLLKRLTKPKGYYMTQ